MTANESKDKGGASPASSIGPGARSPAESETEERALMAAYVAGDHGAFEALFKRLAPRLLGFFRRSVADPALADDLLQTTFIRIHNARDRYRPELPVRPWVFTIAARVRIDALRRRHRAPRSATDEELDQLEAQASRQASVVDMLENEARAREIRAAVDALPPSQRMVVHLHRFEAMSFAEIGSVLGVSEGAARIRAFRAYALLREKLQPLVQGGSS